MLLTPTLLIMELSKHELSVLRHLCRYPDKTLEETCLKLGIALIEINEIEYTLLSQKLIQVQQVKYKKTADDTFKLRLYRATQDGLKVSKIAVKSG